MKNRIKTTYNENINTIIVRMPDKISKNALTLWQNEFLILIEEKKQTQGLSLLLDTGTHDFESIECLKLLRELISNHPVINKKISRVAFVAPEQYRRAEIKSPYEAYFNNFEEAYRWIKNP